MGQQGCEFMPFIFAPLPLCHFFKICLTAPCVTCFSLHQWRCGTKSGASAQLCSLRYLFFIKGNPYTVVKLLFNAGWLVNIKSMTKLYDSIVKTDEMMFICTYKLGQDPLETFFSSIRMKLGCGNNPTSIQFRAAFESLLCNTLNHKVLLSRQISKPAFYKCFHDLQYPQKNSRHGEKKMAYYNRPNFFPK